MEKQHTALGWIALGFITLATSAGCGTADTSPNEGSHGPSSESGPTLGATGEGNGDASGKSDSTRDPADTGESPAPKPGRPGCGQNMYTEALPTAANIDALPFSKDTAEQFLLAALEKRYPIGKAIVEGGISSPRSKPTNCVQIFLSDKSSADRVLRNASTVVHECGHFYDMGKASGDEAAYVIRPDLTFTCKSGDTTSRGGKTFARSLITRDAYSRKRQACGMGGKGCDGYAQTYLSGQSGEQGYNSVLEEATQYVNSLATALAFHEQYAGTHASERDGILTFLWYIERYLAMAHTGYPDAYTLISEDPCWRQTTLSIWDRGWFYVRATNDVAGLGLDDKSIESLVNEPELLAEIDALRKLECR